MIEPWLGGFLPQHGRIALDVGANVGSFTQYLSRGFEQVHAFEPHPQAFEVLAQKCKVAVLHEAAVGKRSGELELNLFAETVHTSAFTDERLDTASRGRVLRTITVPVVAIDDLRLDPDVDFVKVDTEGMEYDVLRGAERTVRASLPALLIEVHSRVNGDLCHEFLTAIGYDLERIAHPHGGVDEGHHWLHASTS